MAEISAKLVKELRDRTGAGMMECKRALQEAEGNLAEAEIILRKRGLASALLVWLALVAVTITTWRLSSKFGPLPEIHQRRLTANARDLPVSNGCACGVRALGFQRLRGAQTADGFWYATV